MAARVKAPSHYCGRICGWDGRLEGWTDRDYDDIRIVIGCPRLEEEGERAVRLTH